MTRLFVDCDDTLIDWQNPGPNPDGTYMTQPFKINEKLVRGIFNFRLDDPWALIVVWSGGGKEYAEMWTRRLELEFIAVGMVKDKTTFDLIQDGDIVIDDEDLGGLRTHGPNEWSWAN